jgi:hypothetical protein
LVVFHVLLIILTGCAVLYSDEQALAWLLGKKELLHPKHVLWLHFIVTFGLAGIIVTGGALFVRNSSYYLHDPTFLIKMVFVGALIVNGYFIDQFSAIPIERPFRSLPQKDRSALLLSGAVSFCGWAGAGICGLVLGHIL